MWFQIEGKLLLPIRNKLDKNREILVLTWCSNPHVVNKTSSSKLLYQLSKVYSKVTTEPFLLMDKPAQVKLIPWREVKHSKSIEVSYQEHFSMSSDQSKVFFFLKSGTPGVNFMVQVSMLELYNEEISDLLCEDQTKRLQIHENKDKGVYVKDLSSYPVTTVDEMRKKLK